MARTVADMSPDEFSDAIANGFAKVNGMTRGTAGSYSGGSGGNATPTGTPTWFNTLANGATNAAGAATKLSTGLYNVNDALGNVKQLGGLLGPVGSAFTGMGTQVAEAGIGINRSLNTVAQSGVHMGQNLGLYDKAVLQARMSMPEFEQTIKSSGRSIAGMSSNMDKSALVFLSAAKAVQDTDTAYQLKATGTSTEEFGQVLTLVSHNAKQDNLMTAASQKSLVATTLALTTEFDNTARLAGISRQEQQQALERQTKSKDMQLAMMAMDADERESVQKSLAGSLKYGEAVQNAIRIYATGGVTNEEEQKQVLAAGPLAKYAEQLANIKGNTPEDEAKRKNIMRLMDEEALALTRNKGAIQEQTIQMKAGSDTTKAMAGGFLEQARWGQIVANADREAAAKKMTREEYLAEQEKKLAEERLGAAAGTGGPEGNAAKLGQTINKVDIALKDVAAGAGTYFSKLNDKAGALITSFGNLNGVLKKYTPEQVAGVVPKVVDAGKEALGSREASTPDSEKRRAGRQFGSLGAVGKLIEDFGAGTDMTLHGKEGVITESQLKGIISTAQQMGTNLEKTAKSGNGADLKDMQLPEMFKGIKTSMEAMIGGPRTQADAEKMARSMQGTFEKELPKMQKQFEPLFGQFKNTATSMGKQMETQFAPMMKTMQVSLKSDLETAKKQMPTTSTFEKMFEGFKPPTASPVPETDTQPMVPETASDDPMTEMVKGVNELNKRIERLIYAVEDGHDKSVRAIKTTGNLIG
jgi:hypothetical protein